MNNIFRTIIIASLVLLLSSGCSLKKWRDYFWPPAQPAETESELPVSEYFYLDISQAEARRVIANNKNLKVIDISNSVDSNLEQLNILSVSLSALASTSESWDKEASYLVYDQGSGESQPAADFLVRNGFKEVYRVEGAFSADSPEDDKP